MPQIILVNTKEILVGEFYKVLIVKALDADFYFQDYKLLKEYFLYYKMSILAL